MPLNQVPKMRMIVPKLGTKNRVNKSGAWLARVPALLIAAALTSCAAPRHLTAEQDADMQKNCEPAGCAVVPMPVWRQIEKILQSLGIKPEPI